MILTDRSKLVMAVGGVTALAAGVYTTRFLLINPVIICYILFYFSQIITVSSLH